MIKNVYWSSCKVPVILVRIEWNLNFLDSFSKNTQISNLIKFRPVGAEFHAGGRTDRHDEANGFWNFVNAPKKLVFWLVTSNSYQFEFLNDYGKVV
jgi:hypothetical protein